MSKNTGRHSAYLQVNILIINNNIGKETIILNIKFFIKYMKIVFIYI